jgi:hypothetical protein
LSRTRRQHKNNILLCIFRACHSSTEREVNEQMGEGTKDRTSAEALEALAAWLADIETELASESEDDKGKIRELRQLCILQLALLDRAKMIDPT